MIHVQYLRQLRSRKLLKTSISIFSTEFEQHFCYAAGSEIMMRNFTHHKRMGGMGKAKTLLKHG